jgi:xylan 1,4-beta-xylosidase
LPARLDQLDYGQKEELTRGLFAASISYHAGFYIANTCLYCGRGNSLIAATGGAST